MLYQLCMTLNLLAMILYQPSTYKCEHGAWHRPWSRAVRRDVISQQRDRGKKCWGSISLQDGVTHCFRAYRLLFLSSSIGLLSGISFLLLYLEVEFQFQNSSPNAPVNIKLSIWCYTLVIPTRMMNTRGQKFELSLSYIKPCLFPPYHTQKQIL